MFRTYEPTRDRLVAVKVFRLDITPEQAQALAEELARAADAGLFHPSIVEPIASGVEGTVAYRAEEYVAGESMDAAIRHYAPATLDKALPFLTQLAGAIDFARAAGVGHGALHLRDIFVTPDEARASGFGVVEALERVGLRAPVRRPYSAPERIAGDAWSTPADVFSLGAIAYELLTGRRPAGTGEQIGALTGDTVGEHPAAVRTVLARAMDDDPDRRYQSALAFASALEAAARGEHVTDAIRDVSAISTSAPIAAPIVDDRVHSAADIIEDDELLDLRAAEVAATDSHNDVPRVDDIHVITDTNDVADIDDVQDVHAIQDAAVGGDGSVPEHTADFDLRRDHEPAAQPASLFDDEPAEVEPAPRYADEFAIADELAHEPAPVPPVSAGVPRARVDEHYASEPEVLTHQVEAERSRIPMLPVALGVLLGLLAGFAGGYVVGSRDTTPASATDAAVATPAAPPAATNQPGKEFSEQAVTPPPKTAPAPPPGQAPDIPGDEPRGAAAPAAKPPAATPSRPAATRGSIDVRSTPSRAQVTVNGTWRGRTPLTLPLAFGSYTVRVVQPGYAAAREEVTLSAADPTRALSFRLQAEPAAPTRKSAAPSARPTPAAPSARPSPERSDRLTGSAYVDSRPRGATVYIDGKSYGVTPARIPELPIGSHVFRLELADHRHWTASKRVVAGQETTVTGSLERIR